MTSLSKILEKPLAALSVLAALVGSLGVTTLQTGCSSTCSASESKACDDTFISCTTASAAAGGTGCQKCADDYCSCYDSCGSTCDKNKFAGTCTAGGG
jgi:hypothetical protein